jgi:glycosyltransferase involved in cell wall biosynthesis
MSGALRIALTCNNYPPEFRGGTERVVEALARGLIEAGDDVVVICGSDQVHDGADPAEELVDGVPVIRLRLQPDESYGVTVTRPRITAQILEILRARSVDVLHVHHWSHLSDDQVVAARDQAGISSVVSLHDLWTTCARFFRLPPEGVTCPSDANRAACVSCVNLDLNQDPAEIAADFEKRDNAIAGELAAASAVVVPSEGCAASCSAHLRTRAGQELRIVPHGLLDSAPAPDRDPMGLPLRVGSFGNLNREKGVLILIDAMAGVRAELHLFGAVEEAFRREADARAADRGVRLHWHGSYDAAGPHPARQLDLAVFPSLCLETYGLVVDEALHHGTPVVVSEIGALPERVLRGGGLSVPPGDVAKLAETIRGLVEERETYHLLRASIPTTFPTIADAVLTYRHLYAKAWAGGKTLR